MNKSLLTNLIAAILIAIGYLLGKNDLIISIGIFALSGGVTNWLAIHMLFEKVPGLYGSGVIPKHFEEFKSGIKHLILTEFFTRENIERFLTESESSLDTIDFTKAAKAINYNLFFNKLTDVILNSSIGGMLGMFGGASALESFREPFAEKMEEGVIEASREPEFRDAVKDAAFSNDLNSDLEDKIIMIMDARLDELTPKMVKKIIQDMIKKHLGWLVVWGGVFGGIIGGVMGFIG